MIDDFHILQLGRIFGAATALPSNDITVEKNIENVNAQAEGKITADDENIKLCSNVCYVRDDRTFRVGEGRYQSGPLLTYTLRESS